VRRALAHAALALALAACGGDAPPTPEEEVRALVEAFARAADQRDAGAALELISDAYADENGRDKRELHGVVAGYFLRNEAIHVVTRVKTVRLAEPPTQASVDAVAALTGAPVADPGEIAGLDADVYRFELEARREDDGRWRVSSAHWRPAQMGDLLP
jgi:ketosteroid isomerase-like protein